MLNTVKNKIVPATLGVFAVILFSVFIVTQKDGLECKNCNVIIISLTNTIKDHVGIYGYERNTTPNIDEFFNNSLIFENAFSPTPWTLPNAVSMFTSLFPSVHNVISRNEVKKISEKHQTLAEILKKSGYTTAAFTGGGDYNKVYGFDRGFDVYDDSKNFSGISDNVESIVEWLNENKNEKFFLFIQGFDTHCPFNPPYPYNEVYNKNGLLLDPSICYWNLSEHASEKYIVYKQEQGNSEPVLISIDEKNRQELIDLYDGEIQHTDNNLERIFSTIDDLKLGKNTIILFLSEHGDLIGENGRFMRTDILGTFSDTVLNIPLLIKHPKVNESRKISNLVNLVDLMPTILSFLDIDYEKDDISGESLVSSIETGNDVNSYVYAEMIYVGSEKNPFFKDIYEVSMVRDYKNKLILERILNLKNGVVKKEEYKFYDIIKDPQELKNVFYEESLKEKITIFKNILFNLQ